MSNELNQNEFNFIAKDLDKLNFELDTIAKEWNEPDFDLIDKDLNFDFDFISKDDKLFK